MQRILIMGVSGCGKSSIGAGLGAALGIPYLDGDDLHPAANVAKMRAGMPLNDDDRWPWLAQIAARLHKDAPLIVGCSALRRSYRNALRAGAGGYVQFVHLAGSKDLLTQRITARAGHFMPPALLDSQLATLEPPTPDEGVITLDISQPQAALIAQIVAQFRA